MSSGTLLFVVCSVVCIAGAVVTVLARNPLRGAVGLLATIVGIAGLFLKLSAEFLAAIQLIVYAGAVVVLFVFVIMLLGSDAAPQAAPPRARVAKRVSAGLMGLMALGVVFMLIPSADSATPLVAVPPDHGTVEAVGALLFTKGIVPFEIATALLIVAVIGAIAVARGKQGVKRSRPAIEDPRQMFAGPLRAPEPAARPQEEGAQ